jgi:hypothetical protein
MSNPTTTGPVCIHCGQPVHPDEEIPSEPIHETGYFACDPSCPFLGPQAELWPAPTGEAHPTCQHCDAPAVGVKASTGLCDRHSFPQDRPAVAS